MGNPYFRFKHFTVFHDRCAMKVGTDGVLLGAWCEVENKKRVLDVGTGCGLIALMLAQRSPNAQITGIDIDESAVGQAKENVASSPFSGRVKMESRSFLQYLDEDVEGFDLIVSNPPFFSNSLLPPNQKRGIARHSVTLTLDELLKISVYCLTCQGTLALIVPYDKREELERLRSKYGYATKRLVAVRPLPEAEPKRLLAELTFQPALEPREESITIELSRHCYSPEFIALTNDFYL